MSSQRYWPGKAPTNTTTIPHSDDSSSDCDNQVVQDTIKPLQFSTTTKPKQLFKVIDQKPHNQSNDPRIRRLAAAASTQRSKRNVSTTSSDEEDERPNKPVSEEQARLDQTNRRHLLEQQMLEQEAFNRPAESLSSTTSGESESSSSSEDEEQEDILSSIQPVFVPKFQRAKPVQPTIDPVDITKRKKESRELLEHELKRPPTEPDLNPALQVNDEDGINEQEEYETWKLREFARLRRVHAPPPPPPQEEEDLLIKPIKSKTKFMQQYYHKGAFYIDSTIQQLDTHQPRPDQFNVQNMPKVMQRKKFGLKGDSKWTHLVNEDTSLKPSQSLFHARPASKRAGTGDLIESVSKRRP